MEVVKPRVSTPVKRRLTTILAADVESYTRLMREDEEATLRTLSEYREVIDGLIERHDGRIFSTAGDSVLAEFNSTVEAVRCAIAFQEEIAARNTELPKKRGMNFRIGLNVGDVMAKGEALYGDGINVAARLEGLADSGGICISAAAFEQVKHKLSLGFEDMGAHEVKNISEPLSVFRLVPGPISVNQHPKEPAEEEKPKPEKSRRRFRIPAKKTLAFGIVAAAVFFWFDSAGMPTVKEACNHVRVAEAKIREYGSPTSLASRALQLERKESWGFRFQKYWAKAQKQVCY
jgi:class 3 adenylate cyclase